jgi:hypothetical protein
MPPQRSKRMDVLEFLEYSAILEEHASTAGSGPASPPKRPGSGLTAIGGKDGNMMTDPSPRRAY